MSTLNEAVEVAAQAWHERLWQSIYEDAQETMRDPKKARGYYDDPAHADEAIEDAQDTLENGVESWEDASESSKDYARNQVRQPILDAYSTILKSEAILAYRKGRSIWATSTEEVNLPWTAEYLMIRAEEVEDESSY